MYSSLSDSISANLDAAHRADQEGCRLADEEAHRLLLADIEARLTDEVGRLIAALREFSSRAKLISESTPPGAHFTKLVAQSFGLMGFQLANALGKSMEVPILRDDGVLYLKNLGINLSELFREVELDGRRFMTVALIDEHLGQIDSSADAGEKG